MATLVLKSTNALDPSVESLEFILYKKRVIDDGGFIANEQAVKDTFSFIAASGITEREVYSATSANWGVKTSGGNPVKLYSLFGSAGDIDVTTVSDAAINYDTTSFTKPVIELKSSNLNKLLSKNFGNINSAGIFALASVPVLTSGLAYSAISRFIIGEVANYGSAPTEADSIARRYLTMQYSRSDTSKLPNDWSVNMRAHGNSGDISTASKDVSGWSGCAAFTSNFSASLYEDGILVGIDNTITPIQYDSDLKFSIGLGRDTFSPGNKMTMALYAYVAETWCMVNTTAEKMRILSTRRFT